MKRILMMVSLLIVFTYNSYSENFNKDLLPELYSPTNAGTDFILSFLPIYYDIFDVTNSVHFYLTSSVNTKIKILIPACNVDTTLNIEANKVLDFSIAPVYVIPYNKYPFTYTGIEKLVEKKAVIIKSEYPVICYCLVNVNYYTEGYLALPVSCLGPDYNIITYNDYTNSVNNYAPSMAVIAAAFDETKVTFQLGGNNTTKVKLDNGDSLKSNYSVTRILNKGDVWVIPGSSINNDLSGSTVRATKPVAVFTGNSCTKVPVDNTGPCGHLIEQEIPTYSFAKRYYVTPIRGRTKGSVVKVSAFSSETEVKLNGEIIDSIKSPNGIEGVGFLSFRINTDNKPAVISSEKRINVIQFNTGNESSIDVSYPFKTQVLSSDHFSTLIGFNTPFVKVADYFQYNYMNIVYKSDEKGNVPDDLILYEFKNGVKTSKKIKELLISPPVKFPEAESDGSSYYCLTINLNSSVRYILKSNSPVGALIYGFSHNDSYCFPAQIKLKNNNKLTDTLVPSVFLNTEFYGIYSGTATDEPANNSVVRSNLALIHLIGDSSYNYDLIQQDFIPGTGLKADFELTPHDITQNAQAYLRISDFAGNDTIIKFFYSNKPQIPVIKLKDFDNKTLCPSTEYSISYDVSNGQFQGDNIFKVKLDRKNNTKPGWPVTIGEAKGALIRKVNFKIPNTIPPADDYFLFVETVKPQTKSDTIHNIKILFSPNNTISGINNVCLGNNYNYTTEAVEMVFKWTVEKGEINGPDDARQISVKWTEKGVGKIKLVYTSNDACTDFKEMAVNIGDDFENNISGIESACRNEEITYSSLLTNGGFIWNANGGSIVGSQNENSVKIKWEKAGNRTVNLLYTNTSGYSKELGFPVIIIELPEKPIITREQNLLISNYEVGNQWYFKDEKISGATEKTYNTEGVEGKYSLQVKGDVCYSDFSEPFNFSGTSVFVSDNSYIAKIFPNPVGEFININLTAGSGSKVKISVLDMNMRLIDIIYDNAVTDNSTNITYPTSKLSSGIYSVRIDCGTDSYYYKVVVLK